MINNSNKRINIVLSNILVCTCLLLFANLSSQTTINGILTPGQKGDTKILSLNGYGPNDLIRITFQTSSIIPLTTTSLIVNFDGIKLPSDISLMSFNHQNPKDVTSYDLDAMWDARKQYINLYKTSSATNLYMTIVNFDPPYRQSNVSYTITIDGPGQSTNLYSPCANGEIYDTNGFCLKCLLQKSGKICSRYIQNINPYIRNIQLPLSPYSFLYLSFNSTDLLTVNVIIMGGVAQSYFQYQTFPGQVASFYNVNGSLTETNGRYFIKGSKQQVPIQSQKGNLLITFASFSNSTVNVVLEFEMKKYLDAFEIILIILLVILIISMIFLIIYKVIEQIRIQRELKITTEQMNRYFPITTYQKLMKGTIDQSQQNFDGLFCIVCLMHINQTDQIRVAYCKHIFHANCLANEFKKRNDCPSCRKSYKKPQIISEYNKLSRNNLYKDLQGNQLAKAILNRIQ